MQSFGLVETRLKPGCLAIQIEGELDLSTAPLLEEALERAASEHDLILVGLERCEFIDSTGIAVIVRAHADTARRGKRVATFGPTSQVLRVLSITGLTENGLVFGNVDEALAASDGSG